jgi:predicted O-methyltransferase YrrM
MDDHDTRKPAAVDDILIETDALGFTMTSEPRVGALLAAVAATKPGGRFLELGTGTGHGTAWLLSGMDPNRVSKRSIATPRWRQSPDVTSAPIAA